MTKLNILCPHFSVCSGCTVNTDVGNIASYTQAKIFFESLGIKDFKLLTGSPVGWRCRAKLAVRGSAEQPEIGLYEAGSHLVIDIPHCRVHHPLINQAVDYLRKWIKSFKIDPYNEKTGKGTLRYVELAVDRENRRIQLSLVLNQRQDYACTLEEQKIALKNLWDDHRNLWHSLWLNFNKRRDNIILGDYWQRLYGDEWLWDRFCGRQICFHPASFAQANPEMFEMLLKELHQKVPHGTNIVEFYAGGGVIGLSLVENCKSIRFNEIVPLAEVCFNESCRKLSNELKEKISFFCGPADGQINLLNSGVDIVIVDPPRKGIDEILLNQLCSKLTLKRLIYVSCGWKSFQSDCKKLLESGWELSFASAYLFFPGTDHLEILAIFDRT